MKIKIEKLERPYRDGDWHDPLLKWAAIGPDSELMHFETKKNAELYRKCRKASTNQNQASIMYCKY